MTAPARRSGRPHGAPRLGTLLPASFALVLAACAGLPPPAPTAVVGGDTFSGRLAVQVDGVDGAAPRVENAAFDLRGDARDGRLDLATPLGSIVARARWSPDTVTLATPRGEQRYTDLDALTRDALGTALPVAALFDWLHGRPWPGAPATVSDDAARPGFVQLGWSVELDGFADGAVVARRRRTPETTVRLRLDR